MSGAYYNEFDPFAAAWLRELIKTALIADGDVDERSIAEVQLHDLHGYTQHHFFAGIGVWSYALRQAGWPDNIECWTGSCPCQPFSTAGKQKGFTDPRHLWPEWFRLVREYSPVTIFGEQVGNALGWLDVVSGDLEGEGYTIGAAIMGAHSVGAPHIRQRLWFVAHTKQQRDENQECGNLEKTACCMSSQVEEWKRLRTDPWERCNYVACSDGLLRGFEPGAFPLATGLAQRVGRLRGYGNCIVAPQAQAFIESYLEVMSEGGRE